MNRKNELRSAVLRTVAIGIVLLFVTAALPAQELTWGGTIDGTGSARFADHLDETDTAVSLTNSLWLKSLILPSDNSAVEVDVQPSYTWTDERPYLVDLDRALADVRVSGLGGSSAVLRGKVGRFFTADASGTILSHTIDGADLTVSTPLTRTRVAAGYTGLILNPVSNIRMSATDEADAGDDEVFFGPRRVIILGEFTFPGLLMRQSVTGAIIAQWDLRDADEDAGEDTLNSSYNGLRVSGPLAQGLFQDVSLYLSPSARETSGYTEQQVGLLASARLRYFRPDWNSSRMSLRGVVISGVGDSEDNFYTISSGQAGTITDLPLINVTYGELSYGIRPFAGAASRTVRDIQATVTGRTILRASTDQPVDSFAANVSDNGRYVGSEASLQLGWRATSDIGTSVTAGAFFPRHRFQRSIYRRTKTGVSPPDASIGVVLTRREEGSMVRNITIALIIALVSVSGVAALDATITAVNGKVELRQRAGGPWVAAETGAVVPVGATISTSFNAGATLQVGESELKVKALTRMRIEELISENGIDRSEIDLPVGRVTANVRGSSGNRAEFRVSSPIATASVRGTNFDFDGANLSVSEGIVVLANRFNESVTVAQGEESSAAGDGAPQKPSEAAEQAGSVTVSVGPGGARPVSRESNTGGLTISWTVDRQLNVRGRDTTMD